MAAATTIWRAVQPIRKAILSGMIGWAAGTSALAGQLAQADPAGGDATLGLPKWDKSFNLRLSSGYKDNVLLSSEDPVGSSFVGAGLDAMLFRLPGSGLDFYLFGSGDYLRYLSATGTEDESTGILQGKAGRKLGDRWTVGLTAQYLYFDQVLDASTIFREFRTIQILGHSYSLAPFVRYSLAGPYWVELEAEGLRQQFKEFLDDYWEGGPKIELGRTYGRRSEWSVHYEVHERAYDERLGRTRSGTSISGLGLRFLQHQAGMELKHYWDAERRWRTFTRLVLERNDDNGGGYYDYWRYQLSQELRYRTERWDLRADLRLSYYDYDHQAVSAVDPSTRHKLNLSTQVRGERHIVKSLKLFGQFEHERSLSNLSDDEYEVNSVQVGFDWEF